ncbi:MAG: hypothetical protein ACI4M9_08395 [Succinivibrio sp.]
MQDHIRKALFLLTGYLVSGIILSVIFKIPRFSEYFEEPVLNMSVFILAAIIPGVIVGLIAEHFLKQKLPGKLVYEHDILVVMIGLLFTALMVNPVMLYTGLFITSAALFIFTKETLKLRSEIFSSKSGILLMLAPWVTGALSALVFAFVVKDPDLNVFRVYTGHFIVLAFFYWVQRLALHLDYEN